MILIICAPSSISFVFLFQHRTVVYGQRSVRGSFTLFVDRHTYLGVIIGAKRERIISSTPSPYQISVSHQFITPTSECKLN